MSFKYHRIRIVVQYTIKALRAIPSESLSMQCAVHGCNTRLLSQLIHINNVFSKLGFNHTMYITFDICKNGIGSHKPWLHSVKSP